MNPEAAIQSATKKYKKRKETEASGSETIQPVFLFCASCAFLWQCNFIF